MSSMNRKRISIVTSSFNQGHFIEETILSILEQGFQDFEYLIFDGGSTDNTLEVIEKYKDKITYFESKKDLGCADALNKGIAKSTGEFFYYLNSDDILANNALIRVIKFIESNPGYDVYHGQGYVRDEINNRIIKIYSSIWSLDSYVSSRAALIQPSTYIRLDFIKMHKIKFNVENRSCWDGELLVDLDISGATFCRMPFDFFLSIFRVHENSITGAQTIVDRYKNDITRIKNKAISFRKVKDYGFFKELMHDPKLIANRIIEKFILRRIN